jgi:hypothetical protein
MCGVHVWGVHRGWGGIIIMFLHERLSGVAVRLLIGDK